MDICVGMVFMVLSRKKRAERSSRCVRKGQCGVWVGRKRVASTGQGNRGR